MFRALMLAALLAGCGQSLNDVQKIDTIEAYETWIAANPGSGQLTLAKLRLEELYLEKARQMASLEGYDLYLSKYGEDPASKLKDKAIEEREEFLYGSAERENTVAAWEAFLAEYPRADKKRKAEARRRIKVIGYLDNLEIGPVEIEPTNLAENPDGPLDGFAFRADVTNKGDKTITTLNMKLEFLDAEGKAIGGINWPLVAPKAPGNLPIEEEWKVPVKPGETRLYSYSDMAPEAEGWVRKARLVPIAIAFAGEDEEG